MERRCHTRRKINVPLRIDTDDRKDRFGITRNISIKGVQFHSPSAFSLGDRLDISLYGLGSSTVDARSMGTVVRVERNTWDPMSVFPHITSVQLDAEIPSDFCPRCD
jgi:hypothetical protein